MFSQVSDDFDVGRHVICRVVQRLSCSAMPALEPAGDQHARNDKPTQRAEKHAVPATSDGTPPYTDPLPAPEVAAPDDTERPTLPPRHMVDDADPSGDNPDGSRGR